MKKSELIAKLNAIKGDFEVYTSSDPEGNSFNNLDNTCLCLGNYNDGEFVGHPDDLKEMKLKINAIVIYP